MQLRTLASALTGLLVAAGIVGCGSSSYQSDARAAIKHVQAVIRQYNSAPQSTLAQTVFACRTAHDALTSDDTLANPPSSGAYADIGRDLQQAYQLALAGFADCAASAPFDYTRMANAQTELSQANAWLVRAVALDHS